MVEFSRREDDLRIVDGDRILGRYQADPEVPRDETPKPYWHPLCTFEGRVLTDLRPPDHLWHHGLQFGVPKVGETNLWGGNTFTRDAGYILLDDHGRIGHAAWSREEPRQVSSLLRWEATDGSALLEEERRFVVADQRPRFAGWSLRWESRLRSVTDRAQLLQTPEQMGRPGGGYAGLFLRAAPGVHWHRWVMDPHDLDGAVEGAPAEQLLVLATVDGHQVTLLAADRSATPVHWLVRDGEFSALCWSPLYRDARELQPGEEIVLRHELTIVDGWLDPQEAFEAWPGVGASDDPGTWEPPAVPARG